MDDGQASSKHVVQVLLRSDGGQVRLKLRRMQLIEQADQQLQCFGCQDVFLKVGFFVHAVEHVQQKVEATFAQELLLEL